MQNKNDHSTLRPAGINKLLIAILFLALALRLLGISHRQMWFDEAYFYIQAEDGLGAFLESTVTPTEVGDAADNHPPGYFTLLWAWMQVFGSSTLAARLFSVFSGLGVVAFVYMLGRRLFGDQAARAAAFLTAISPFQIHFSQEVRMYALYAFFLVGATYVFWRALETKKTADWGLFALLAALAQYTHSLALFYLVPLALIPFIQRDWPAAKKAALAGVGAVILYLPWLLVLPSQLSRVGSNFWIFPPGLEMLVNTLLSYVINLPLEGALLLAGLAVSMFVTVLAVWLMFNTARQKGGQIASGMWMLYLAVVPPALLFGVSQAFPVYVVRATLPSAAMFLIWLGWLIAHPKTARSAGIILTGLMVCAAAVGIYTHVTYQGFPYAPYQDLGEYLQAHTAEGDAVVHSNKLTVMPMLYYFPDLPQAHVADVSGTGSDIFSAPSQQSLGAVSSPTVEHAAHGAQRVWFIIFTRAIDEYIAVGAADHPHLEWLKAHYHLIQVQPWGDLRLYLFEK